MGDSSYAYLTLLNGEWAGRNYPLDASDQARIGRGADCTITVNDPLCSRVHAVLSREDDRWIIRDAESRNGTLVNGQKVREASVGDGHTIRIGSTEFTFQTSAQPATSTDGLGQTLTIVQDAPVVKPGSTNERFGPLPSAEQVQELMLLYQLSIKLLGCEDPRAVVTTALELLHERTRAAVVSFLWVTDDGKLRPKLLIPAGPAEQLSLSPSLSEMVVEQARAVWVANQGPADSGKRGEHYADAVCAPLVSRRPDGSRQTLGAIHVYLRDGHFRQSDFDFAISVANIVAVSLAHARELSTLQLSFQRLVAQEPTYSELIGESKSMLQLKAQCTRVARASGAVLIRGESGVGKELVARAIHQASARADRPMVAVNCAAIPADLMESQLFGHRAGAFTGADRDHVGFFQQADLGTLFLDEVGELTLAGQAKLLRILEGHPFLPVGASEEVRVDVRVLAATNQDLSTYVREKRFREDLYYRLSVFELTVPPLRERGADIGLLVDFFLEHFRKQHGRPSLKLADGARQKLLAYHWPGNVRQLRNVVDSAVALAEADAVQPSDVMLRDSGTAPLDSLRIEDWEKRLIAAALERTGGNVPEAAKLLGIGRATLYRKIEQYHIER